MAVRSQSVAASGTLVRQGPLGRLLEREAIFSWLMLAPALLFLLAFVAYPFVYGVYLSLQQRAVAQEGVFVGLQNYVDNWHTPIFWQVAQNTVVFTFAATVFKLVGGMGLALVMNQQFPFKNLVRAALLLPWIVPTVLSTIAWMWIFDPTFSVINWTLVHTGLMERGPSWIGDGFWAMVMVIIANVWRGLPFYAITLLAALQTISGELYEAAAIDGANASQRFWRVTLPLLKPVLIITTMFSVIWTFSDFQLVYVLTAGGPSNATHLFATYAFNVALGAGQLGSGASIALSMLPPLLMVIAALSLYLRRS
ncbi:MAG TPA: sugar ABC transporter permease [Chloroflexota bacterium]|nr:sugar ABC transporter permease [Chloroflexota bacterium]